MGTSKAMELSLLDLRMAFAVTAGFLSADALL